MFSLAVKLADLDDFIENSQNCTQPILVEDEKPDLIKHTAGSTKGKVNLTDCLACSGCVTSAEAVFLEQQSTQQLLAILRNLQRISLNLDAPPTIECADTQPSLETVATNSPEIPTSQESLPQSDAHNDEDSFSRYKKVVVSFSEASEQFLRQHFGVNDLFGYLHTRVQSGVFDDLVDFAISERITTREIQEWIRIHKKETSQLYSAHCPGWVCYAEKSCSEEVVNKLVPVATSQIFQGLLVKFWLPHFRRVEATSRQHRRSLIHPCRQREEATEQVDWSRDEIYHVVVQPCYDKKLECARPEFTIEGTPLVDLVLGTNEFIGLLQYLDTVKIGPVKRFVSDGGASVELKEAAVSVPKLMSRSLYREHRLTRRVERVMRLRLAFDSTSSLKPPLAYNGSFIKALEPGEMVAGNNEDHFVARDNRKVQVSTGFRNLKNSTMKSHGLVKKGQKVDMLACPQGCLSGSCHQFGPEDGTECGDTTTKESEEITEEAKKEKNEVLAIPCTQVDVRLIDALRHYLIDLFDSKKEVSSRDFFGAYFLPLWRKSMNGGSGPDTQGEVAKQGEIAARGEVADDNDLRLVTDKLHFVFRVSKQRDFGTTKW